MAINQVTPPAGPLKKILPIAGKAIGAAYGGPAGAEAGGMVGDSLAGPDAEGTKPIQSTAMGRRYEMTAPEVPHAEALAQADQALAQLPPQYQQQYGPTITAARMKQQGVA